MAAGRNRERAIEPDRTVVLSIDMQNLEVGPELWARVHLSTSTTNVAYVGRCARLADRKEIAMPRLSIDITAREHQQLKAMAALKGQSIKDYVLTRALVDMPDPATMTDHEALEALKQLLAPRIAEADAGQVAPTTAEDIKREARERLKS